MLSHVVSPHMCGNSAPTQVVREVVMVDYGNMAMAWDGNAA